MLPILFLGWHVSFAQKGTQEEAVEKSNKAAQLKDNLLTSFDDLLTQYNSRLALIPGFISVFKTESSFSSEGIKSLTDSEALARKMSMYRESVLDDQKMKIFARVQSLLRKRLGNSIRVAERYPQLQSNPDLQALLVEYEEVNSNIAEALTQYQTDAKAYNAYSSENKLELLPALVLESESQPAPAVASVKNEVEIKTEEPVAEEPSTKADEDPEIFMIVDDMPELIGGLGSIQRHIIYPDAAKRAGIEGRVFVQFIVDVDGNVTKPVVVRGIGYDCDEEAMRAVSLAKFKPGRRGNEVVPVKMSLPITFKLK